MISGRRCHSVGVLFREGGLPPRHIISAKRSPSVRYELREGGAPRKGIILTSGLVFISSSSFVAKKRKDEDLHGDVMKEGKSLAGHKFYLIPDTKNARIRGTCGVLGLLLRLGKWETMTNKFGRHIIAYSKYQSPAIIMRLKLFAAY